MWWGQCSRQGQEFGWIGRANVTFHQCQTLKNDSGYERNHEPKVSGFSVLFQFLAFQFFSVSGFQFFFSFLAFGSFQFLAFSSFQFLAFSSFPLLAFSSCQFLAFISFQFLAFSSFSVAGFQFCSVSGFQLSPTSRFAFVRQKILTYVSNHCQRETSSPWWDCPTNLLNRKPPGHTMKHTTN